MKNALQFEASANCTEMYLTLAHKRLSDHYSGRLLTENAGRLLTFARNAPANKALYTNVTLRIVEMIHAVTVQNESDPSSVLVDVRQQLFNALVTSAETARVEL